MMLAVDPDELAHEESIVDAEVQLSIEPGGGSGPGELADADKTVEVRDSRDFLLSSSRATVKADKSRAEALVSSGGNPTAQPKDAAVVPSAPPRNRRLVSCMRVLLRGSDSRSRNTSPYTNSELGQGWIPCPVRSLRSRRLQPPEMRF